MWVSFNYVSQSRPHIWLVCGNLRIIVIIIKPITTTCINEIGLGLHILLSTPPQWTHLRTYTIRLRNQQTFTLDNHNKIRGGPTFTPNFTHVCCRFADATQVSWHKYSGQKLEKHENRIEEHLYYLNLGMQVSITWCLSQNLCEHRRFASIYTCAHFSTNHGLHNERMVFGHPRAWDIVHRRALDLPWTSTTRRHGK